VRRVGHFVEAIIFNSRWLIAPFLLGLVVGLAALVLKFLIKLYEFVIHIPQAPPADVIVGILTLVDLTLVASLIVLVICSIYDNFISDIDPEKHPEWPEGLVKIGFSGLKQKLFGAIAVIAAVNGMACGGAFYILGEVDIVIAAVIAVTFGVIFWAWNTSAK